MKRRRVLNIYRSGISRLVFALAIFSHPLFAQVRIAASNLQSIPFVGCKADGQVGPLKAPKETTKMISLPSELAHELAYYKAEGGVGVLAPRGWYCFETYGSSG